jgi:FMN reductase
VGGATVDVIDLCDYARDIFRWPHDELAALALSVASADLAVFASPTYKASYTGLLKAFLDRYPNGGLTGLTAVPVMTGSDPIHGMAPEVALRPLLVELGASAPTRGLYFVMSQMGVVDQVLDEWAASNFTQLVRLVVSDGVDTTPSGS